MSEFSTHLANRPEVLEEVDIDEENGDLMDNDDVSTIMGDDDDEENIEKQMQNEESKEASMDAIDEEDDMANAVFRGHTDCVYCSALHPTEFGTVVTGGGDDKAYLWRFPVTSKLVDSGEQVNIESVIPLEGHTDTVTSVGFNFDGSMILTGSYDGTVRIWDKETGDFIRILDGPEDIEWAVWHNKGNAIMAGSRDGTLWMWLADNGQCLQVFAGHEGAVSCGTFALDGKVICSGGEDGTMRIWAPKTGACKHVFDNAHDGLITSISCSSKDPALILTGSVDGSLKLFHVSNKRILSIFVHTASGTADEKEGSAGNPGEEMDLDQGEVSSDKEDGMISNSIAIECVGFCHTDMPWIASGGMDQHLKIWDLNNGQLRLACVHGAAVVSLVWQRTLPMVTTGSLDHIVRVWDARNGDQIISLTGHSKPVTNINALSFPSGKVAAKEREPSSEIEAIVSVADDQTARLFLLDLHNISLP